MSVMYSLFLLGALSLCSLADHDAVPFASLREESLKLGDSLTCDAFNCECAFSKSDCCCGANDMFDMEDTLFDRIMELYSDIYTFKSEVQSLSAARKIAFQAHMTDKAGTVVYKNVKCFGFSTHDMPIPFDDVTLNEGNGYNSALGTFTAPVNGVYMLSFTIGAWFEGDAKLKHKVVLFMDGDSLVALVEENKDDAQDTATQYVVVKMLKGNQVYLQLKAGRRICQSFKTNTFSGFMLYPLFP